MGCDRFDLETYLMQLSQTEEDIDLLAEGVIENELGTDEIANALVGLKHLFELRFSRVYAAFEELIRAGKLENPKTKDYD